jgi:hypothetical protein
MPSNSRVVREAQMTKFRQLYDQRLGELQSRGLDEKLIKKDPIFKQLKAKINKTRLRLEIISNLEKQKATRAEEKKIKLEGGGPKKEKKKKKKEKQPAEGEGKKKKKKKKKE